MSTAEFEGYASITRWQSDVDMVNGQNCFALNFGYSGEMPFPALAVDLQTNLEDFQFERYCKCFYVFVGGEYVRDMENVVYKVGEVSKIFHGIKPTAIFLPGMYSTLELKQISFQTEDMTLVIIISIIHIYRGCHVASLHD